MCHCGLEPTFEQCCQPYIQRKAIPTTAEACMRSRYSAFAVGDMDYIRDTNHPDTLGDFDQAANQQWADESQWLGLEITSTSEGQKGDDEGIVEFVAHFRHEGFEKAHHEVSTFKKIDEQWYFHDGKARRPGTMVRQEPKVGRNDPCVCGSGKKYKKCCLKGHKA